MGVNTLKIVLNVVAALPQLAALLVCGYMLWSGWGGSEKVSERAGIVCSALTVLAQVLFVVTAWFVQFPAVTFLITVMFLPTLWALVLAVIKSGDRLGLYLPLAVSSLASGLLSTSLADNSAVLALAALTAVVAWVLWIKLLRDMSDEYDQHAAVQLRTERIQ